VQFGRIMPMCSGIDGCEGLTELCLVCKRCLLHDLEIEFVLASCLPEQAFNCYSTSEIIDEDLTVRPSLALMLLISLVR